MGDLRADMNSPEATARLNALARPAAPGPGEANKQPNIGQSRTGHFNDGIQTAVAANDAPPVGPPAPIEQAPSADPMAAAKSLFPKSMQRSEQYAKVSRETNGFRASPPVRSYDDSSRSWRQAGRTNT
jgi:hypothetical protein